MQLRRAADQHVKARGARCSMIVYGLVTIAVLVSLAGAVMSWSTMVEKKLVSRPDPGKSVPEMRTP